MKIFAPKPREAVLTIPNIITSLGFVFAGLYVWSFLVGLATWKIFSFLFLAGMTDTLDGISARFLRQETALGEILDPIRDRALMIAILWNFWLTDGEFARLLICVILFLETAVSILNARATIKEYFREIYHFYGKTCQAGHVAVAGFCVLGILKVETALTFMLMFTIIALHGAMIGCLAKKEERRMTWKDLD
jgi:cardiolipin synthase